MAAVLSIENLRKVYDGGFEALKGVSLEVEEGEILALLGPNGAGKTTLISCVCGITNVTSGSVRVAGHDISREFRAARSLVGLVPQEVTLEPFEKVRGTVAFSRGLFGGSRDDAYMEKLLRTLALWDKRDSQVMALSGGMKRRVLIAKALSHNPRLLFLDEPTAGVDVELRKGMWNTVQELRESGVTVILTTHYIAEAEAIADRIGVINDGRLLLVEEKTSLMKRMGKKTLLVHLETPIQDVPESLRRPGLELGPDGESLVYTYDTRGEGTGITALLKALQDAGMRLLDVETRESSLEDIFVDLVQGSEA